MSNSELDIYFSLQLEDIAENFLKIFFIFFLCGWGLTKSARMQRNGAKIVRTVIFLI